MLKLLITTNPVRKNEGVVKTDEVRSEKKPRP